MTMNTTDTNHRRDFLKKIPLAIFSIGAFSLFRINKSRNPSDIKFKSISKSEANDIIKNNKSFSSKKLNPAPAPNAGINIKV